MDWKEPIAICVMPLLCGVLWFAACDFGVRPFAGLLVVAIAACGFLLGWSIREWSKGE